MYICIVLHSVLCRVKNVVDKNQNIHFLFDIFSRKSWRLWDTVEKYGTPGHATDDIIRCMCFACWITKATDNTFRICNTLFSSTTTLITRMRFVILLPSFFVEGEVTDLLGTGLFLHIRDSFIYSYVYIKRFKTGNKPLDIEFVNIYYKHIMVLYQDKYRTSIVHKNEIS